MNIQPVKLDPHGFTCVCNRCNKVIGARHNEKEPRYADLDGKPFETYYCQECKDIIDTTISVYVDDKIDDMLPL